MFFLYVTKITLIATLIIDLSLGLVLIDLLRRLMDVVVICLGLGFKRPRFAP